MIILPMKRTSLALAALAALLSSCDHKLIGTTGDCSSVEPQPCYPPVSDAGAEIEKTTCACILPADAGG